MTGRYVFGDNYLSVCTGNVLEKHITASIRQLLKNLGIFHWKAWQGMGSTPGVPDIIGIYQGRFLGIEVKRPGGKLSPHQERFLQNIREQGGIAILAYDVEDVIKGLGIENSFLNFRREPEDKIA